MTEKPELILKDDGYPVTALLEGAVVRIIQPPETAAWICLQLQTQAHESQDVQNRMSQWLPPQTCQIAIHPDHAHKLGMYLMDYARRATAPE